MSCYVTGGVFLRNPGYIGNDVLSSPPTGAKWLGATLVPAATTSFGEGNIFTGAVSNASFTGMSFICAPTLNHTISASSGVVVIGNNITTSGALTDTRLVALSFLTLGSATSVSGLNTYLSSGGAFDPGAGSDFAEGCVVFLANDTGGRAISIASGCYYGSLTSSIVTASGGVFNGNVSSLAATGGTFAGTAVLRTGTLSGAKFTGTVNTAASSTVTISSGTFIGSFTTGISSTTTIAAGTFIGAQTLNGTVTINGGNFIGSTTGSGTVTLNISGSATFLGAVSGATTTVTVSGAAKFLGTVTLAKCANVSGSPIFYGTTTLTASAANKSIVSGAFYGTTTLNATTAGYGWTVSGVTMAGTATFSTGSTATVTVSGGTFLGATTLTASGGAVTVSGGTFRNNVTNTTGAIQSGATIYGTVTNASGGTCAARLPLDILNAGI